MTARETAERHAQDVVDGNLSRIMGDFAGSAFTQVMGTGGPPLPTTKWEILAETPADEAVVIHVRYSNDAGAALELKTTWTQFDGGVWKIIDAEEVAA